MILAQAKKFSDIAPTVNQTIAPKIGIDLKISELLTNGGINLIDLIFFFIGLVFLVNILLAAYEFISCGGDPKKVQAASTRLINGIVGVLIALASFIIIRVVTEILGIKDII